MLSGKADCGLQYAVRKGGSAVAYCALSIRCGTRDEKGYHSGIAHFVEHTIFKGTQRRSASVINSYLDRLGGELNAFTTKEEIVFHATVLKEDLPKAADLLLELATMATFPENEINTEKGVVIDEIQSYKDTPSEDIYDRFEQDTRHGSFRQKDNKRGTSWIREGKVCPGKDGIYDCCRHRRRKNEEGCAQACRKTFRERKHTIFRHK